MTDPKQAVLAYLEILEGAGIRLGLERVAAVAGRMGDPQRRCPVIQVAGTNGKGSVSATIAAVLSAAGYRTGFYLSPHLREVTERIRTGAEPIGYDLLLEDLMVVKSAAEAAGVVPTYFEALTLAAFRRFAEERVDCAVVEVGMGGRLDATSVAEPVLAVITEIDRDHTEHLGPTLEAIAREKAAIARHGIPTVIGTRKRALARSVAGMVEERGGIPHLVAGNCFSRLLSMEPTGQTVELVTPEGPYRNVRMALVGQHQAENLLTATRAIEVLRGHGFPVTEAAYRQGVSSVRWPGRFEVRSEEPLVILDGAHNPAGITALVKTFRRLYGEGRGTVVLAPLAGKNLVGTLPLITTSFRRTILARVAGPRGIDPATIPLEVVDRSRKVERATGMEAAIREGLRTLPAGDPLVVTGSLAGVGEAAGILDALLPARNSG